MATLWQDLRFSARILLKDFPFTIVAILSLALGIGLNTAIFTFLNAVFLRPFPVRDPAHLISIVSKDENDTRFLPNSYPNYLDYRSHNDAFTDLAAFQAVEVSLASRDRPELIIGQMVTGNFFDVLGVKVSHGRTFLPEEDKTPGTHPVIVLSDALWRRRFEANPGIVGKTVLLNGQGFTVVGIAAEGFKGTGRRTAFQFWVPLMMYRQVFSMADHLYDRDWLLFRMVGRLKPRVTPEKAEANLKVIAQRLAHEYPKANRGQTVTVVPFMHEALGPNDRYLFVRAGLFLTMIVALVLLGACANVANLLLARSAVRRQEISVRLALGAGRFRLIRQLLTESLLLSLLAGALGLVVASWSRNLLTSVQSPFFSNQALDAPLDSRVLLYALLVSVLTGLIFGLAPTLQSSSLSPASALKGFGLASTGGRWTLRNVVLVLQVALSFVSLVAAGWFLRSLYNARQTDPGFESKNLLLLTFNLNSLGYSKDQGEIFSERLLAEAAALPGVRRVGLAENRLLAGIVMARSISLEDAGSDRPEPLLPTNSVSLGYFDTLGIPIIRGRAFTEVDHEGSPRVAIINEAMARRYWPNENPLGRRFRFEEGTDLLEVVGIARDSKFISLTQGPQPYIYLPLRQNYTPTMTLYVRAALDTPGLKERIRKGIQRLDPQLPLDVATAADIVDRSLWAPKMAAVLLSIFGGLALLLASLGIYSIVAFTVQQRKGEIGLRMALGARRLDIFRLILREGMEVVGMGLALGVTFTVFLGSPAAGLLYEVSPADPATFGATALLLTTVALMANLLPARRASQIQPLAALHSH
jgi:predicted permease